MRLRTLVFALCLSVSAAAQPASPDVQLKQLTKQARALAAQDKTEGAILLLQKNLATIAAQKPGRIALADALELLGTLAGDRAGQTTELDEARRLYRVEGTLLARALALREEHPQGQDAAVGRLYYEMQQAASRLPEPAREPAASSSSDQSIGIGMLGTGQRGPRPKVEISLAADATGGATFCVLSCDPEAPAESSAMDPADVRNYRAAFEKLQREAEVHGAMDREVGRAMVRARKKREALAAAYAASQGKPAYIASESKSLTIVSPACDAAGCHQDTFADVVRSSPFIPGGGSGGPLLSTTIDGRLPGEKPAGSSADTARAARAEEERRREEERAAMGRVSAEEQLERAQAAQRGQQGSQESEMGAHRPPSTSQPAPADQGETRMEEKAEPGTGGGSGDVTYSKHQTIDFEDEKVEGDLKKPGAEPPIAKPNVEYIYPRERFPQIDAPEDVATATEFVVQVSLTEQQTDTATQIVAGEKTAEGRLRMNAPASGGKDWTFDVVLSAPGFSFTRGSNTGKLVLPPQGDSTPAQFWLRARGPLAKPATLTATLWQDGQYIAKVMRVIVVRAEQRATRQPANEASADAVGAPAASAERSESAAKQGAAATQRSAAARAAAPAAPREAVDVRRNMYIPDLTLFLLHDDNGSATLVINSPYLQPSQYTLRPNPGLDTWLKAQYSALVRRSVTKDPQTPAFLRGFGRELYQQFAPAPFKEAFWKLADKLGPRFRSIQIFTDDPTLPWELMRPSRADGTKERDFLGLDFSIARWHVARDSAQLDRPEQYEEVEHVVVLAPHYEGDVALPAQEPEVKALSHLDGYAAPPARLETLRALLHQLPQGIIHFAGHGQAQRRDGSVQYAIQLEDGVLDLMTWRGLVEVGQRNHPIFFMNACEIGSANAVANFVDGWAPEVLRAGASGYIGALWAVDDNVAGEFARQFYAEYEKELQTAPEVDVGELLARTRREVYAKTGSPTALAYVFYGDANLKLVK